MDQPRRSFLRMLGLGGLFGTPAAVQATGPGAPHAPVMTYYVNVGSIRPEGVGPYLQKTVAAIGPCPEGWLRYIVPVRSPQISRIEVQYPQGTERAVRPLEDIVPSWKQGWWADLRTRTKGRTMVYLAGLPEPVPLADSDLNIYFARACRRADNLIDQCRRISLYELPPDEVPVEQIQDDHLSRSMQRVADQMVEHNNVFACTLYRESLRLSDKVGVDLMRLFRRTATTT